ncbi:MAG: hypothetical protein IT314_09340 [Anaerolineales bacterium]|nr:hypothetical protein [Anaerolineales bacterium]
MNNRFFLNFNLFLLFGIFLASACSPSSTPTPFIPPTAQAPLIEPTFIINPTQNAVVIQTTPLPTIAPTISAEDCVSNLTFVSDLTIPDGTFVTYYATIDKQWLVQNSGTCNWDETYRLRHIGGADLGAPQEIMLYPAKSGAQASIQIVFTAPFTDGEYESAWQAFDSFGLAFGDPIYIRVNVASP